MMSRAGESQSYISQKRNVQWQLFPDRNLKQDTIAGLALPNENATGGSDFILLPKAERIKISL